MRHRQEWHGKGGEGGWDESFHGIKGQGTTMAQTGGWWRGHPRRVILAPITATDSASHPSSHLLAAAACQQPVFFIASWNWHGRVIKNDLTCPVGFTIKSHLPSLPRRELQIRHQLLAPRICRISYCLETGDARLSGDDRSGLSCVVCPAFDLGSRLKAIRSRIKPNNGLGEDQ